MSTEQTERTPRKQRTKKPLLKSARLWAPVGAFVVLVGLAIVAGNIATKGLTAKDELEAAIPLAASVQEQLLAGDQAASAATVAELAAHTSEARKATSGRLWGAMEWVPFVGSNMAAVRVASATVDDLVTEALKPATGLNLDALKPVDGAINVEAVRGLATTAGEVQLAVQAAQTKLGDINQDGLIDQLSSGLTKLDDSLGKADSILNDAMPALNVLPGMLGGDGPRNYLMVMQGTAEARASGGGAGVFILLTADNGNLDVTAQHTTADFDNNLPETIVPLDAESLNIYSPILGTYITNLTGTPNWPTSAALAQGWWSQLEGQKIDGVGSFDPVALGYLLETTGPVALETGDQISAENAAPLLLNEVYFRYPDPVDQDAFFEAAAGAIFDGIKSNISDPKALITALMRSTDEGRLKFWSVNPDEQAVIAPTTLSGILPVDNTQATVVGAYFNDTTGSKMDYYVDAAVSATSDQCTAEAPTITETITLTSSISPEAAEDLPAYVTGPYYEPGFIATDILVYGPVGSTITSITVNGAAATPVTQGTHLGRPVMRISHVLAPLGTATVVATMTGAAGEYGPLEIRTTPLPRATPLAVDAPGCK